MSDDQERAAEAKAAVEMFIASRAMEILREWMSEPEIAQMLDEAARIKEAEAARKDAA
jgi:hypothetical protein